MAIKIKTTSSVLSFQSKQSPSGDVDPLHCCRRLAACHVHIGNFLKAILRVNIPQDALLAVCALLPLRERRAFSFMACHFGLATALTWSC